MRGIIVTAIVVVSAVVCGCKQQCYVTECDLKHYQQLGAVSLERDPLDALLPPTSDDPPPTTILDPEREVRPITLSEAIAIALEQGTVGIQSPFIDRSGSINDLLTQFTGAGVNLSDSIRVLALQPAITGANIDASLSKFDTRWFTSLNWTTTDQPVASALQTIQAGAGQQVIVQDNASLQTSITKPLPTGGLAGITFSTQYQISNLQQRLNPSYQPALTFNFEQPLLQGFGVEINQLRDRVPFPILVPFQIDGSPSGFGSGGGREGILITRIRFDQQRTEFDRNLNFMLVNIEVAYWNLYSAYWTLYAREQALRQGFATWRLLKAQHEAGREPIQELAQARQQYELFRGQRLAALADVLEKERQLRGFLGMPTEDGFRLVPIDAPTLAPFRPNWQEAMNDALAFRPELIMTRLDLRARHMQVQLQKNFLMPDLRFVSQYGIQGIGSQLDGSAPFNALSSLSQDRFQNWQLGLQLYVPLGFREAHANLRQARLALAQSYQLLHDQELKAKRFLELQYRRLFETHEQIKIQQAQREAAAIQLRARYQQFQAGLGPREGQRAATLDVLLEAQRVWAEALRAEYENIAFYNQALAGFEFAKGTIQRYDNVAVSEGELPMCAQVRAVEHEKSRSRALLLRHRAEPLQYEECGPGACLPRMPNCCEAVPLAKVPQIRDMFKNKPALAEVEGKNQPLGMDQQVDQMLQTVGHLEDSNSQPG
ncbi:MAG: TolC family protein, partial [Gemmataceae bacterium]